MSRDPDSDLPLGVVSPAGRVALQAAAGATGKLWRWPGGSTVERLIQQGRVRVVASSRAGSPEVVEVVVGDPLPDLPV